MSDYTISYSRQKQLEKEETLIDEEVNKAKVVRREPFTIRLLYEPETENIKNLNKEELVKLATKVLDELVTINKK